MKSEIITKLRIAVARCGEMDRCKWWNTKGMLSSIGEMAISRGFPKTHVFARCRAVFAVAAARSDEVFNPPDSFTLWRLPVEIEDRIEDAWAGWLENPEPWKAFLEEVDEASSKSTHAVLTGLGLVSPEVAEKASKLRRADDLRSVPFPYSQRPLPKTTCERQAFARSLVAAPSGHGPSGNRQSTLRQSDHYYNTMLSQLKNL